MKLVFAVDRKSFQKDDHIGVRKKVETILEYLKNNDVEATLYQYDWENGYPGIEVEKDTDILYFRRIEPSLKLIYTLIKLKMKNLDMRIVMEIPTYPFSFECIERQSIKRKVSYFCGEHLLKYVLNSIVLTGQNEKIKKLYGVPVIHVNNGVDYSKINFKCTNNRNHDLVMIAVSGCFFWHGYDRMIEGMKKYYEKNIVHRNVSFHIVGTGDCIEEYREIAKESGLLNSKVFIHGSKQGEELDDLYSISNIAVDCLGCHRKRIYYVSSLKSKEYGAQGLPIITSVHLDIVNDKTKSFICMVPDDESPIRIDKILQFYDSIYARESDNTVREEIRNIFLEFCDINYTFDPLLAYLIERRSL